MGAPNTVHAQEERLQMLLDSVHMAVAHAVEGDIAEFGSAQGHSINVIAGTMALCDRTSVRLNLPIKRLHVFDSFQGLPAANLPGDVESPMVTSGVWGPGKCSSAGYDAINNIVANHLAADRYTLYPGWFADTLPTFDPAVKFALVHLDCDLYESSLQVLTDLFEKNRFSDGCILLCDDFLGNRASKKFGQRKAWEECVAKYKPQITDLGFYSLASWRCIIHVD